MKNNKLLKSVFVIALIIWAVMLIKQQISIQQYKEELNVLASKIELNNNKEDLEQKKENTQSLEYIENVAREKLGMYLQNERVYVDSNM